VAKGIVSADKARLLPGSGVDLDRFVPAPLPDPMPGQATFLLIARMLRDKGVVEFVEAARVVRKAYPKCRFQLLGFVAAENRTALSRAQIDEWVAEGVVEYAGAVDDVRPCIAAADCVVLPSYREGLPRTLLEAAAVARPLIATDVPGCRDIVTHEENGLLCAVRDAHALAAAMIRFVEAPAEQRERWALASRDRVERDFSERTVIDRYMEAIGDH
jgi:glycosyltransferase involved in cell wall biosynthesis